MPTGKSAVPILALILCQTLRAAPAPLPALHPRSKLSLSAYDAVHVLSGAAARQQAEDPARAVSGARRYTVVNIEFADAAACAKFKAPEVYVFHRYDKWADAFIESDKALQALQKAAGVVWVEGAGMTIAPPARRGAAAGATGAASRCPLPPPLLLGALHHHRPVAVSARAMDSRE